MNRLHLLSTVAASLLLTAGIAQAQTPPPMPERAPAAQQKAPAEKVAPSMKAGEHKAPETTGQGTHELKAEPGKSGSKSDTKSDTMRQDSPDSGKTQLNEKSRSSDNATSGSGAKQKSSESVNEKSSTTGQGAAAGSAKLSTEQRTKITTIIKRQKVAPAHLNVSVHVGARVPQSVHYYPLPTEVVEIYPEWRGYMFILVGDEIVVVNPRTHLIVAVLEA
jgi:hypothetical protein